jgi:hypothetical protein
MKEMPKIAAREIGALEASLSSQADALGSKLEGGLSEAFLKNMSTSEGIAKGITDTLGNAFAKKATDENTFFEGDANPFGTPQPFDVDTSAANAKLDKTKAKANDIKNIGSGSAEQMQRMALASLAAPVSRATQSKVTNDSGKKIDTTNALLGKLIDVTKDADEFEIAEVN